VSGSWSPSANAGFYGTNSLIAAVGTPEKRARWSTTVPTNAEYEIFAWWVPSSNRSSDAPYIVTTSIGDVLIPRDQRIGGGGWNSLGTFPINAGPAKVELSSLASTGSFVSADAVRWVLVDEIETPDRCVPTATFLQSLGGFGNCFGNDLPGGPEPISRSKFTIHSDLPEIFNSNGVLYTTAPILPVSAQNPIPLSLRTQINNGFAGIDDTFEVFIFHISQPGNGTAPRRIVVHARNDGPEPVTIRPRQVIVTQGVIGNIHEMESNLGRRWMEGNFDTRFDTVTLQPGEGGPIGYSNNFAGFGSNIDANINCFGLLLGEVLNPTPQTNVVVSVVAIPSGSVGGIANSTNNWLGVAATSAESQIDITTPPGPSELRRVVGVFPSFQWRSDVVTMDVAALPGAGTSFQMALSQIQANSCPLGRQTTPVSLHPGFAHGDTIGNYQVDYRVQLHLVNSSQTNHRAFDVEFGRSGADIGLAWRVLSGSAPLTDAQLDATPVFTEWAGPSQSDGLLFDSLLEPTGGAITLPPCGEAYVSLRFTVLGNSSLPFQLRIVPATPVIPPVTQRDLWQIR
jgi:hypothetical protein